MTTLEEPRSIEDREARIAEIDARIAELNAEFANTKMSDEARDEWNRLNAERDRHAETVAELKLRHRRLQQIAGNQPEATERATGQAPAFIRSRGDEIYDLTRHRAEARSDEDFRDRLHDNAKRAIERASFPAAQVPKERAQERALEMLESHDDKSGTLAKRMLITGNPVYQRAFGKAITSLTTAGLSPEEQRAMSLGTDSAGGYAVPFDLDPTVILTNDGSSNPLRAISRVEMIAGKEWQGVTSEGITVTRTPEVAEADDNSPTLAQPAVRPSAVQAFVPFSMDLEMDWAQLRSQLTTLIADSKDNEEADSFINGDGSLISGGGHNPQGIVAGLPASSEVAAGGSFTSEDVYALEDALGDRWLSNASFLGNRAIYNLVRQFDTAGGADLWVRLGAGQPAELIGYPAYRASAMPKSPTGRYLVLGDFRQFLIVDRIGMSVELVPHLFGANNRFPTGQRGIYARWRNTTKILVPNAFRVLTDDES